MRACWAILFTILAGCAVGPDYRRPATAVAEEFKEAPDGWKQAQPRDEVERGKWWEVFGDAQLNALIEKIDVSNQTLAASEAQYRQGPAPAGGSRAARASPRGGPRRRTRRPPPPRARR